MLEIQVFYHPPLRFGSKELEIRPLRNQAIAADVVEMRVREQDVRNFFGLSADGFDISENLGRSGGDARIDYGERIAVRI